MSVKLSNRRKLLVLLFGVFVLLVSACATVQKPAGLRHTLQAGAMEYLRGDKKIIVLPPKIDYALQSLSNDPVALPVVQQHIAAIVTSSLLDGLKVKGYQSQPFLSKRNEHRLSMFRLREDYNRKMSLRSYTNEPLPDLGPEVNVLSASSRADLLMISRYSGTQRTTNQQRKDSFVAVMRGWISFGKQKPEVLPEAYGALELALIDGVTGQTYWRGATRVKPDLLSVQIGELLNTLVPDAKSVKAASLPYRAM